MKKNFLFIVLKILVCLFLVLSISNNSYSQPLTTNKLNPASNQLPPGIVLIIGDGMGPQQIGLMLTYFDKIIKTKSNYQKYLDNSVMSLVLTSGQEFITTDSACSATEIATGQYSHPSFLGLNQDGKKLKTIVEYFSERDFTTALVTDTRVTHATPGAFYAKINNRYNEFEIAKQLLQSSVSVVLGGGRKYFINPKDKTQDLLADYSNLDYKLVSKIDAFTHLTNQKILGVFGENSLDDAIYQVQNSTLSLEDLVELAFKYILFQERPFFIMIEAGQIDWAGHVNDAGWLLAEMLRLDRVLKVVDKFVGNNPKITTVITADHETGGFSFNYKSLNDTKVNIESERDNNESNEFESKKYDFIHHDLFKLLSQQKSTLVRLFSDFKDANINYHYQRKYLRQQILEKIGVNISSEISDLLVNNQQSKVFCFGEHFFPDKKTNQANMLARLISNQTGVSWSSGTHTSTPVILLAKGKDSYRFKPLINQVETGKILLEIAKSIK